MSWKLSLEAKADLLDAFRFYESQREGLGIEVVLEVGAALTRVVEAPKRWPLIGAGVRKYRVDRFPLGIFYRVVSGHDVIVLSIFDLRSQSGSWGT